MLRKMNLRSRIIAALIAVAILSIASVGLVMFFSSRSSELEGATKLATETAGRVSFDVENQVAIGLDAARTLAQSFEGLKAANVTDRAQYDAMLKSILSHNPALIGAWTLWEPNALDGQDAKFANTPGSDATGRYIPYWNRGTGQIAVEALENYETPGAGNYYLLAKTSGEETVLDPYLYKVGGKEVLMTSLVVPIKVDGKFVGVVGVDIAVSDLSAIVAKVKPYAGSQTFVVANNGHVTAHENAKLLDKSITDLGFDGATVDKIKAGELVTVEMADKATGTQNLTVFVPMTLGETKTPWAIALSIPMTEIMAGVNRLGMIALLIAAVAIVVAGVIALVLGRGISSPIISITESMDAIVKGDLHLTVPYRDRLDEIGRMAGSVEVFRTNAIENARLQKEAEAARIREEQQRRAQEEAERRAEEERRELEERQKQELEERRRAAMLEFANRFEARVMEVVKGVSAASTEMQAIANSMADMARGAMDNTTSAASVTNQTSSNVQMVAASTEELSASIAEISGQVNDAARVAQDATDKASHTNTIVVGLSDAAQKIGEVVSLINDIAGQTNLLALNATIEAARAGDAGKGFAVVASEVKSLATETAKATDEISAQIAAIQNATKQAVSFISDINTTVQSVSEISSSIAAAVEQQNAATSEISRSVQQVAVGNQKAVENIGEVSTAVTETGQAATDVLSAAGELSQQANVLRTEVESFLAEIRAA